MNDFRLNDDIVYAIDLKGVSVLNKKNNAGSYLDYPEAAVWLVYARGYPVKKSEKMLMAILGKNEKLTEAYLTKCFNKWKKVGLIK